ncbi:uncharacterized protein LOC143864855 isoform X2 [Tasmannia lanceolata]|uniref:uncharacterized protein LOC143864855 isoform X2 n=1 Tax=Tasmannia lanceolata TaxID=3420 RepID=UPI004063E3C9
MHSLPFLHPHSLLPQNAPIFTESRFRAQATDSSPSSQIHMFPDIPNKVEKMVGKSEKNITRVLFCGTHWPSSHNYTREYLQNYPFIQVDNAPLDDVPDVIGKYQICIVKNGCLDSKVIARADHMKLIMQFGVGLEGVDVDAATRYGIKVARIPADVSGNSASCAELAIYLMLGLLRKQVFIMGFGKIGIDLAKRLRPFGVRILATKQSWALNFPEYSHPNGRSPTSNIKHEGINCLVDKKGGPEDKYDFAREADIVVACLPLNNETVGIVDRKFISSMKEGALLVNMGRGGLLDYESVVYHLESGHLGGLGIDVAWNEPIDPDDLISKFSNVLITPHIGGVTEYSYRIKAKIVAQCALQLHKGAPFAGIEFVN